MTDHFLPSGDAAPIPALPNPSRYFVNIAGFSDSTAYVRADADGRCFAVERDGHEWLYSAGALAAFVQKVRRGIWRELTDGEAVALQTGDPVKRALAFVAEFKGDGRCALNCFYAEAVAAEIKRLRLLVPPSQPETPTDGPNLRIFRDEETGRFFIYNSDGSGSGMTPEAAMREWVRCRNTFVTPSWPVAAFPVVQDEAPKAALQRYERDVVSHVGGHYGEEQWQTTEMVPCETGAWVKWRDVAALGASRPSPADRKEPK